MWYGTILGAIFGAMVMIVMSPAQPNPPENCGIRRVTHETQVAYVLKAPEPMTCVTKTVEPKESSTRIVSPDDAQETPQDATVETPVKRRAHARRRHRHHYR